MTTTQPTTCPGSGKPWRMGTGTPICPICHVGPGGFGAKKPVIRKGRFTGVVPQHAQRKS